MKTNNGKTADTGPYLFAIKTGLTGKIRLFFRVLNHPWQTVQTLIEFGREHGETEAEVVALQNRLAETIAANCKLREEIHALKNG
ncbi:MAG: hypothetical protein FWD88_05570 [Treponema sp.]|nr:hypothetical protein [Treponema sp.]